MVAEKIPLVSMRAERRVKRAQTCERGPPLKLAEFFIILYLSNVHPPYVLFQMLYWLIGVAAINGLIWLVLLLLFWALYFAYDVWGFIRGDVWMWLCKHSTDGGRATVSRSEWAEFYDFRITIYNWLYIIYILFIRIFNRTSKSVNSVNYSGLEFRNF